MSSEKEALLLSNQTQNKEDASKGSDPSVFIQQQPHPTGAWVPPVNSYPAPTYTYGPLAMYTGPYPDSHSTLAWLTCMFCFWPLGLAAIIKSNEVNNAIVRGDMVRAQSASDSAKKFGYISLGCGVVQWVITVIFIIIYCIIVIPQVIQNTY